MGSINADTIYHIISKQGVGIAIREAHRLGSNKRTMHRGTIGLHKLGYLFGRPYTPGIGAAHIRLVLHGDSIELHAILSEIIHIVVEILRIVGIVLFLQIAHQLILHCIARVVGLPFCRLSPRTGKDDETHLFELFGRVERLAPVTATYGKIEANNITA